MLDTIINGLIMVSIYCDGCFVCCPFTVTWMSGLVSINFGGCFVCCPSTVVDVLSGVHLLRRMFWLVSQYCGRGLVWTLWLDHFVLCSNTELSGLVSINCSGWFVCCPDTVTWMSGLVSIYCGGCFVWCQSTLTEM